MLKVEPRSSILYYEIIYGSASDVEKRNQSIPIKFQLYQNFPNPFNSKTTIRYDVPANEHVVLKMYNVFGQEIRTLVNDFQEAGKHTTAWDAKDDYGTDVATGLYILNLNIGKQKASKKILLMK